MIGQNDLGQKTEGMGGSFIGALDGVIGMLGLEELTIDKDQY